MPSSPFLSVAAPPSSAAGGHGGPARGAGNVSMRSRALAGLPPAPGHRGGGNDERPPADRSGPVDRAAAPRALRCYLVEDSAVIRQNLIATLQELLSVDIVGTAEDEAGAVAWMQASGERCDLMIIDLFLKGGTGLEVLRRARLLRPGARLVVLSNYATPDMRQRCRRLGADGVFDKSMELDELIAYCESLVVPDA